MYDKSLPLFMTIGIIVDDMNNIMNNIHKKLNSNNWRKMHGISMKRSHRQFDKGLGRKPETLLFILETVRKKVIIKMLECMAEYFENKADRYSRNIRKLHEVGYGIVDISKLLGIPEVVLEKRIDR